MAIPAWSVPRIQSVLRPRIRFIRTSASCIDAVQRVAHVQRPGHVRRRDRDREVLLRRPLGRRVEVAPLDPLGEDPPLDLGRVVAGRLLQLLSLRRTSMRRV